MADVAVAYLQDQAAVTILEQHMPGQAAEGSGQDADAEAARAFFPVRPLLRENYETGSRCSLDGELQDAFEPSEV
jgi:hypothetical protein